ncbi:MAG: pseudouridine synthase [Prevotellaceae bacterium]|jgi:23S rRNA pseudouridine2605 synthase|nr:pseudouridine synthase [Prevotellaceae bacterium]
MSKKKATFAQIIKITMTERKSQRGGRKEGDKSRSSHGRRDSSDSKKRGYTKKDKSEAGDKGRKPWTINSDDDSSDKKYKRKESSSSSRAPKKDDKPKRNYGDKDKPKRRFNDDDKPKRNYGDKDKDKRRFNDDDKPKRSYGDKDKLKRRFNDEDKPKRSYKNEKRSEKRTTKRDDSKKRSFKGDEKGFDSYKGKKKESYSYISSYEPEDSRVRKNRLKATPSKPKSEPKLTTETRLNKFIANSGVCSRREADTFIKAGLVSINGVVVTELGTKVMPNNEVRFNGELLHGEKKIYLLMNKPKGYVTTVEDPHADKTVMDIVRNYSESRIYPVGRLDKNSTGVLLLTNDGELTLQLTHPSYNKKKIYQVKIDKPLTKNDMQRLADGIELEDGLAYFDVIEYLNEERTEFGVEIHSGRNRIIRRMFEYLGYKVSKLDRVYFAGLTKKNLKRGECRFLTEKEVSILKMGSYE